MTDAEQVLLAATFVVALGALVVALGVAINQAVTRGLVDDANDRASRALEIVQDRPADVVVWDGEPDTIPSGIPLQVHSALIETEPEAETEAGAEIDDDAHEWREFQVGGETRRFRVRIAP